MLKPPRQDELNGVTSHDTWEYSRTNCWSQVPPHNTISYYCMHCTQEAPSFKKIFKLWQHAVQGHEQRQWVTILGMDDIWLVWRIAVANRFSNITAFFEKKNLSPSIPNLPHACMETPFLMCSRTQYQAFAVLITPRTSENCCDTNHCYMIWLRLNVQSLMCKLELDQERFCI